MTEELQGKKSLAKWITTLEFADLQPNQMFHRQIGGAKKEIQNTIRNKHILFRKDWTVFQVGKTIIRISADDYYKLYINGQFVGQGPASGYHFHYFYNEYDITSFLQPGKNIIAVHTYYQGLINRVWVSGDNRHGLWLEVEEDGKITVSSDESFRVTEHSGFTSAGITGYETQYLERYDASAKEIGFEAPDFDDSKWGNAVIKPHDDHQLFKQPSQTVVSEEIEPVEIRRTDDGLFVDFGGTFVGSVTFRATGKKGDEIALYFGQELNQDGTVRYHLRAYCDYQEFFKLSGKTLDTLQQFDYKSFRYAELKFSPDIQVDEKSVKLIARHYPFSLKAECLARDPAEKSIWNLCVRSLHYGVQEVIQDCMGREKGYYLGDGCYSLLTFCLLTKDYTLKEKFFDDFLRTSFINRGLMTCANCSMMQEIAEYPLIMFTTLLEYLVITGNKDFVRARFDAFADILDFYREEYAEADGLLNNLDKWCVVDWPKQSQDDYDVDVSEWKVCKTKHNVINAYYIGAIKCLNRVAAIIGHEPYADVKPLEKSFFNAFYDPEKKLFRDSAVSAHISLPGNIFAWWFEILPDEETRKNIAAMAIDRRLDRCSFFIGFPMLCSLLRDGYEKEMHQLLTDDRAWLNMIREGATTTFENWRKDGKWNTSLFHLTLTYGAAFLTPWPIKQIFSFSGSKTEAIG